MNTDKEKLLSEITGPLKETGYKKRGTTWIKQSDPQNNIFIVVNIQGSQFDKKDYYVNLGVYIKDLGRKEIPSCIADCHMQERISSDISSSELFMMVVRKWESLYGSYAQIYERITENKMPMLTDKRIYSYFLVNGRKQ